MSHLYGSYAVNGAEPVNAATRHQTDRDVKLRMSFSRPEGWDSDFLFAVYFSPSDDMRRRVAIASAAKPALSGPPGNVYQSGAAPIGNTNVSATVRASLPNQPTETLDQKPSQELSSPPWHAVYVFEQHSSQGSFLVDVPSWAVSAGGHQAVRGYGIWLFTRRQGHKLHDGSASLLWEREAHGWAGGMKRMDGSRVCAMRIKVITSSTKMRGQTEWLLHDISHHITLSAEASLVRAYIAQTNAYWHTAENWPSFKNLPGLGKWYDSSRAYPINGLGNRLPMFSHLVPITFHVPIDLEDTPALFNRLGNLAAGCLGYSPHNLVESTKNWTTDPVQAAMLMEMLSEICTMWLRTIEYTIDNQHGRAADEWEFLNNAVDPREARFDCEDGSEYIVRMVKTLHAMSGLRSGAFSPMSALSRLMRHVAEFASIYEPCMVLCTLRLPGQGTMGTDAYTYHACVVMLDRNYLEMHTHLLLDDDVPVVSSSGVASYTRSVDGDSVDVRSEGAIHAQESAGHAALRHKAMGEAARHAIMTDFHTAFVIESTTYVSAARYPPSFSGRPSASGGPVNTVTDDIVFTVRTDASLPEALRMGDGSIKLSNTGMYGTKDSHNSYGRVLFFIAPYLLDRGLTDMIPYDEHTPGIKSVPMLDFLNYAATTKIELPSADGGEHLGDFIRAVHKGMGQMPMFMPIGSGLTVGVDLTKGDVAVVSSAVSSEWWPFYLRPAEVSGFLAVIDVDASDTTKVKQYRFEVCMGCDLVQVLVNKSLSSKHGDIMTRRWKYG